MNSKKVAVIGGGLSGLACARRLTSAGVECLVIDKGFRPGGRLASRRLSSGSLEATFDHGAQYLTARERNFRAEIDRLGAAGAAGAWRPTLFKLMTSGMARIRDEPRFAGVPDMNALPRRLAEALTIRTMTRVTQLMRDGNSWRLGTEGGEVLGPFDAIVTAIPAEQAAALLAPVAPDLAREASQARTAPCWAAMLLFDRPLDVSFDAAIIATSSPLAFAARARQLSAMGADGFVLHATRDWSRQNLESDAASVAEQLTVAFQHLAGATPPVAVTAHRWRYAKVEIPIGSPYRWSEDIGIGICGDWRLGPRAELAWRSGDALGATLSTRFVWSRRDHSMKPQQA